jgi:hypothetical protein
MFPDYMDESYTQSLPLGEAVRFGFFDPN